MRFAKAWSSAGHPLPPGFDNDSGLPPSAAAKVYQAIRDPGHGQRLDHIPIDSHLRAAGLSQVRPPAWEPPLTCADSDASSDEKPACLIPDGDGEPSLRSAQGEEGAGMRIIDIRSAGDAALVLLFICVIGQPLVYAYANGFSISAVLSHTRLARSP